MPNWCEGTLKIRGDYEAIKRFAAQGIQKTELEYEGKEFEETIFHVYDIGYIKGTKGDLFSPITSTYMDAMGSRAKVYVLLITVKLGRLAPLNGKRFRRLMALM